MAEVMKSSGIGWVGIIPESWEITRNKYVFYNTKEIVGYKWFDTQLLSLTKNGVKEKDINEGGGKQPDSFATYQIVRKNDLVMCLFDLDQSAVFSGLSSYYGMISPAYKILKCQNGLDYKYAAYWFDFVFDGRKYKSYSKNIRFTLDYDEFGKIPIIIPPANEQKMIADFLDEKCAEIDKLSEDIKKQIGVLEEYKKSVITRAVTKGLDPNARMKESGIEWCNKVPSHWNVKANKYIMSKRKDIQEHYRGENILSLTMNGVIVRDLDAGGKMPTTFDGYQKIMPGNLLMCLFDYDVTPRCIGLIRDEGLTSPAYSQFVLKDGNSARYYYYYYLMIDYTKELLHLAKNLRHSFTEEQIGVIKAPVPPIAEQEEIANYLDEICLKIDDSIIGKQEQINGLLDYKKSIIYEYVTGKKCVKGVN